MVLQTESWLVLIHLKRGLVNEPGSYSVDEDKISDDENKILGQYLSEANLAKN